MKCAVQTSLDGTIYISSFMKTVTDIHAILRVFLRNLNGCNDGITDERDL
jgi:hypothetical protein